MKIHDSGKRTDFETGAVRDGQDGKGRMDLLPMRAIHCILRCHHTVVLTPLRAVHASIEYFMFPATEDKIFELESTCWNLMCALNLHLEPGGIYDYECCNNSRWHIAYALPPLALIEVSRVFEAGAVKYEERNWEKGIPLSRYLDSGIRHFYRHLNSEMHEPHLAMACWNFLCMYDTILRIKEGVLPESLNDLPFLDLGEVG